MMVVYALYGVAALVALRWPDAAGPELGAGVGPEGTWLDGMEPRTGQWSAILAHAGPNGQRRDRHVSPCRALTSASPALLRSRRIQQPAGFPNLRHSTVHP